MIRNEYLRQKALERNAWNRLRTRVFRRVEWTCQICLNATAEDVHHIIPKRQGGLDVLENLTSVCAKCHKMIELLKPIPLKEKPTNRKGEVWIKLPELMLKELKLKEGDFFNWSLDIIDDKKGNHHLVVILKKEGGSQITEEEKQRRINHRR